MATSLEKKAEKNIIESIDKLVTNSFLMLLFESLVLKTNPALKDTLKEKSVKEIYEFLVATITDLRRIIDESGEEKELRLSKCLEMKDTVLEVYGAAKTYISACNILDLCIEERIEQMEAEESEPLPLNELKKLFRQKTERLLDDAIKHDVEEAATAILFTVLPNYFSDSELVEYITYSTRFYFDNSSLPEAENHVKQIMRSFAPQKMPDYGKYYAGGAKKLLEIIESVRISGFDGDFGKSMKKYEKLLSAVEGIADSLSSIYAGLTYLSIILSSMFAWDDIIKNDPIYEDFFKKTAEELNGDKCDESVLETMLTRLDSIIEKEVEQLNEIAKRKELIYKNVNFENFSENTKTLFSMEFFLTTAFFENIDDMDNIGFEFEPGDEKPADLKTVQRELKSLTLFIKESCLGMNETLKRSARRNLFLSVPLASCYDKSGMMKYVDKLCENIKSAAEIEGLLSSVEKIIEEDMLLKLSILEL